MNAAVWSVTALGLLSLVGGVIGFVKARSRASLIAGSFSGLLLLMCAHARCYQQGPQQAALVASGLVALSLGVRFFMTWRQNQRVMPDLIMVLLSAVAVVAVGMELFGR